MKFIFFFLAFLGIISLVLGATFYGGLWDFYGIKNLSGQILSFLVNDSGNDFRLVGQVELKPKTESSSWQWLDWFAAKRNISR
ncbi:MAG: hypothetical protein UU85_C0003G0048 [Candidatus Wolfebacteria bacterium GW2011_GWA2_42_10]|uniref:Uncharacterized protein n=2 Tax=Candidatus Wolfeibacteriota TaxID=1752735 RepID=A0A0G0XKN2_9BACT|nr:MAG: hypothetical protein UU38_C0001G0033 [Candidatus Wolfebacteria bacterium GW2011_GWB1_41_12]KKS25475.1 MAG: hypothetical protein UU85_C0003G0048 [Candidatus Wolfebacteria bacterium GW2011_GWA2_42_10]KKT56652.1 MAG: hypothetical protein UW50_C0001G0221 [Candidatus Wolfebacteria bacterium GW2011_GWA1_44_24]